MRCVSVIFKVAASATLAACAGTPAAPCGPPACETIGAYLAIVASEDTLRAIADSAVFMVVARDSAGATVDTVGAVEWKSSQPLVATIDSTGVATAVGNGTTAITAIRTADTTAVDLTVVQQAEPAAARIQMSNTSIEVGRSATVTLRARDARGNDLSLGGDGVSFSVAPGGAGVLDQPRDNADGTYTSTFVATSAVALVTASATMNGQPVDSTATFATVPVGFEVQPWLELPMDGFGPPGTVLIEHTNGGSTRVISPAVSQAGFATGNTQANGVVAGVRMDVVADAPPGIATFGGQPITRAVRYRYPNLTTSTGGRCNNYTITLTRTLPQQVYNELAIEGWVKFSTNFDTGSYISQWGCGSAADLKLLFATMEESPTTLRWEVKAGHFAGQYWVAGFEGPQCNNSSNTTLSNLEATGGLCFLGVKNTTPTSSHYDNTWFRIRVYWKIGHDDNGTFSFWVEEDPVGRPGEFTLKFQRTDTDTIDPPADAIFRRLYLTANRNHGANADQELFWSRVRVWSPASGFPTWAK